MKFTSAIAALALVAGTAHMLATPHAAGASPRCTPELIADGSVLYSLVVDAKPIRKKPPFGKAILPKQTMGAKLYLHAEKGMTREHLHRAAMCHRNAVDTPAYKNDPLRVDGKIKSLRVYSYGGTFVLSLTADKKATGQEIWRRAEALTTEVDVAAAENEALGDF